MAEEKSREERRKEGRKDAGVSAFWQTNASIPGGSSTESVSVSLFLFRSSPTFPPRASQPLFLFLFLPRVPSPHHSPRAATRALRCTLLTENRGPPPSPSPSSNLPGLSSPRAASSRPSHRYYALAPARQRQITLHFQSPKELQRPIPPSPVAPSRHLRSRSSSTAFHGTHLLRRPTILMPLSSFLPRPPPTTPSPSPSLPAASETLCYVGHQMGAQPPTHSGRASCPRTTSRLLQLCQPPRILLLPPLAPAAAVS